MSTTTAPITSTTRPPFPSTAPGSAIGFERINPITHLATYRRGTVLTPGTDGHPVLPGHVLVVSQGVTYQVHAAYLRALAAPSAH